jgi:hypothetical protein
MRTQQKGIFNPHKTSLPLTRQSDEDEREGGRAIWD